MPGKIPDRWEAYKPLGKPVSGTRFISFKVPLEERMTSALPENQHFTPAMLVDAVKEQGFQLGLVIDLTNTRRYYKSKELESLGLEYAKIFTQGHVVPSNAVRRRFYHAVDSFLQKNSDNELLVGVHCTHGLNRTGYLVCRYMIDKLDVSPEQAIQDFNDARGYNMERENYLQDLKSGKSVNLELDPEDEAEDSPTENPGGKPSLWYGNHKSMKGPRQPQHSRNTSYHKDEQYMPNNRQNRHHHTQAHGPQHPPFSSGPHRHFQQSGSWNNEYHQNNGNSTYCRRPRDEYNPNGRNSWEDFNQQGHKMEFYSQGGYGQGQRNQYVHRDSYQYNGYSYRGRGRGRASYSKPYSKSHNGYGNKPSYGYGAESQSQSSYGQFGRRYDQN